MTLTHNCRHLFVKKGWSFGRFPWKGRVWKCEFCGFHTRSFRKKDEKAGIWIGSTMSYALKGVNTIGKRERLRTK